MRTNDILMPTGHNVSGYSAGLYLPSQGKIDEMTAIELRPGLCAKSAGDWHNCERCAGGCVIGRRLSAIMRGEVMEPTAKTVQPKPISAKPITLQTPSTRKRLDQIHAQSIERAAAAILLHEQGTGKSEAAHAVGLAQWANIRNMARLYPAEVEKAKRRLQSNEPPATP